MDDATIITGDFNGTLLEDGNVTGDLNATDPDGLSDGTYFLVSSDPANGSVAIDPASGNWFYTSNPNFDPIPSSFRLPMIKTTPPP